MADVRLKHFAVLSIIYRKNVFIEHFIEMVHKKTSKLQ